MSYKNNINLMYLYKFFRGFHLIGGVLVPFFLTWGEISFSQLMVLEAFFGLSVFLLEIPTGTIADYFSRKLSLILGALSIVFAIIVYTIKPSFYLFMLGEFLWALGYSLMSGADQALTYDSLKKIKKEKESKKIFGRFSSAQLTSLMIAGPIGGLIASTFGLRYVMMFMAIPFFIASIIAAFFKEPVTRKKVESFRYWNALKDGVTYFKKHKKLKIIAFDRISIYVLAFLIIWLNQPLLMQLNVPIFYFGFIYAGLTGVQIIVNNLHQNFETLFRSKKRYLLFSGLIAGLGFIFLGLTNNIIFTIVLILIVSAFGLTRQVLLDNYMHKHIVTKYRATVMSSISMIERIIRAIVFLILGVMVEFSLDISVIIIGIAIISLSFISRVEEEHLLD